MLHIVLILYLDNKVPYQLKNMIEQKRTISEDRRSDSITSYPSQPIQTQNSINNTFL